MIEQVIRDIETGLREGFLKGTISHVQIIAAREPRFGRLEKSLPEPLASYLKTKHISLYTHQCEAMDIMRGGGNLIITTPTASGKTLAFTLPVLEKLLGNPMATAFFLYPTKALSNDQLKVLTEMEKAAGIPFSPRVYDGDTPASRRSAIRERSRIVISNLHELHQILPWHYKWEKFFRGLSFIVIDEAHRYRGILGSNAALLIRRLRRVCRYYGSEPQFVLSTATLANPCEFSKQLIGLNFQNVFENGAPSGKKAFVLYNPFAAGRDDSSTHREAKELLVGMIQRGLQTICFTGSRKMAELIAMWAIEETRRTDPSIATAIAAYKGRATCLKKGGGWKTTLKRDGSKG